MLFLSVVKEISATHPQNAHDRSSIVGSLGEGSNHIKT